MSVWEKVYKNPKTKGIAALGDSLSVSDIKLPKRSYQLPSLFMGLALGTTFTKRTIFCQLGSEFLSWNPEASNSKQDLSVFRIEKVFSDIKYETALGEDALSQFMSDRGDPSCTLFLQPNRFLLSGTKMASYVTSYEGQKILFQSPTNKDVFQYYIRAQFKYLWDAAHSFFSEIRRFQIGNIIVETPDYFSEGDLQKYRTWFVEAAQEFFPPILSQDEEQQVDVADKFIFLPESLVTLIHWLTDQVEPKLAASELEIKKLMVRHGLLPRTTDPVNFLVVTMGATHSRVVRIKVDSFNHLASAKRVGETIPVFHNYLGRTGFGGDHISCSFLEEEEERRYGATVAHRVNALSRKVLEDWSKMGSPEGRKHFEELCGDQFTKAVEKLGELTIKGFGESPENTVIILGGKLFEHPYFQNTFREHLQNHRVPQSRIVTPSKDETSISRACQVVHFHQKGLGRSFTLKSSLDAESGARLTWRIGKVVEGTLVDTVLEADNRQWDNKHPREFTVSFERGVRRLSLGYQKSAGGISQLWANVNLKTRVTSPIQVTLQTEGPNDLRVTKVKSEGKTEITADDFQIEMLIAGEHPSHFPLYDKILKIG